MALVWSHGPLQEARRRHRRAPDRRRHRVEELLRGLSTAPCRHRLEFLDERGSSAATSTYSSTASAVGRRQLSDPATASRSARDYRRSVTMTELTVGTKKGLFVLEGNPGGEFKVRCRAFPGEPIDFALRDPGSGRLIATSTSPFYGPKIWFADGPGGEWTQAEGVALPEGGEEALERIWVIVPGEGGSLWAGGAQACCSEPRRRTDLGAQRRAAPAPGRRGLAAGGRRAVSALDRSLARRAGSVVGGRLGRRASGTPRTMARPGAGATGASTRRTCPRRPVRIEPPLRTPDGTRQAQPPPDVHPVPRWRLPLRRRRPELELHRDGLPSDFGFPIALDPSDPDSAYVIPLTGDFDRVTPEGVVRVYETRDGGRSWTPRGDGLPAREAYLTVLRRAFGQVGEGDALQLTSGDLGRRVRHR